MLDFEGADEELHDEVGILHKIILKEYRLLYSIF